MLIFEKSLAATFFRHWWVLLLRGLAAIAFGIVVWLQPGISLTVLVLVFAIYSLLDGVFSVWIAIAERKLREHWWLLLLQGFLGIAVGIITFLAPAVTALVLLFFIAIRAIVIGVLEIVIAMHLRKVIQGEWMLILGGLLSIIFGGILIANPGVGVLAVLWLIAAYAIAIGILLVILAFKARSFNKRWAS